MQAVKGMTAQFRASHLGKRWELIFLACCSDDNVSLSDPESDTDAGESGSEEVKSEVLITLAQIAAWCIWSHLLQDFVATDRLAEEVYKEPQPDSDTDSAHAAHHDQGIFAEQMLLARAMPSTVCQPSLGGGILCHYPRSICSADV